MDLEGKVALVTGGAVRIGRALSLALAGAGCRLVIHYASSAAAARRPRAEAAALGVEADLCAADLADAAAAHGLVPAAAERFGRLDVLINSAALFLEGGLTDTGLEVWERQFAVNLRAPFLLSQAFAAQLPGDRHGAIVNVTDARIFRPAGDHFAYRLTKSALWTMTEMTALELAPRIRVNAVALGAILPPPGAGPGALAELVRRQVPLRRSGGAEAVADAVLHLLRQEFMTGVTVRLDGGQFL